VSANVTGQPLSRMCEICYDSAVINDLSLCSMKTLFDRIAAALLAFGMAPGSAL
jgi:hypothetical protein